MHAAYEYKSRGTRSLSAIRLSATAFDACNLCIVGRWNDEAPQGQYE